MLLFEFQTHTSKRAEKGWNSTDNMFYIGPWIKAFSCRHDCFSNGSNFPGQFRSEVKSSHFSIPIELASGLTIVRGKRGGGTNIHTYRRTKTIKITKLSKNRANVVRFFFFQTYLGGLVMWGLFYFFFLRRTVSEWKEILFLFFCAFRSVPAYPN